jgi:protein tyrosine phosphatase (PTP) superfamily phosphohydrolase (DUF442 family)
MNLPNQQIVDKTLVTSGQPSIENLKSLKENGFTAVVNISPKDTKNYISVEGQIVGEQDLTYVHLPMDCSNLQVSQYETIKGILNSLRYSESKILVHCGANIKSSGFVHIYRIKELGHDENYALEEFKKTPSHEPKWWDYFERFALKTMR